MRTLLLFFLILLVSSSAFSQSASELNEKSKDYLTSGDIAAALPLLKEAAELGNAEAQYNYGVCFQQGVGVSQDEKTANEWFLKSANQGWKDAQFKLAYSYATGRGIAQDSKSAFQWALKCAEQNDPACMFNVVSSYMEGYGTEKNIDSMMVWANRLGALENPENLQLSAQITSARLQLAQMYKTGNYVTKDLTKSYSWLLLYNESKQDFSILEQQKNIELIKEVEKELTKTQIAAAKKVAEESIGRPLRNLDNLYKQDL
ncbi:tetratricopeptide repeat protein [uncultured Pontibacter sp.]|uniref:tetratricopeptide repeat protein n=1 Tax=uncultured Pontibacter sp. TaxID=453356 RepID=UPI00261F2F64|nr:tetratricopeptide repeat protein [uncultured Pontibacter sp.]